jgi:hypothetical protein
MATVLGPIDTVVANKFGRALAANDNVTGLSVKPSGHERGIKTQTNNTFKTGPELLYGGQGKINCNVKLGKFIATTGDDGGVIPTSTFATTVEHEGLEPPRLEETDKEVSTNPK